MRRVLVTGGAGFVGSHVVDALVAAGHEVRVLDSLHPAAHRDKPDDLDPTVEFVRGDVADPEIAAAAVAGVDAVCHQASMVGLGVDFGDVADYVAQNDLGTAVLLQALHARGRPVDRLVLASSMVVYGEGRYRCRDHGIVRPAPRSRAQLAAGEWEPRCPACEVPLTGETVREDAPVDPRNVYAATKLHQEHLCFAFGREHPGVAVTALRYHNVYGPRMPYDTPYAGVASIFRSALAEGRAPHVFEDGGQRRDFVHVRDVARANLLALTNPEPVTGAYNIASGTPRTVCDMAEALCAAFPGAPRPVVTGEYRLGDVRHVVADPTAARTNLGFTAEVDFSTGMHELAHAPMRASCAISAHEGRIESGVLAARARDQ
ncbi:MAG TPA: NAD-dependent epimerase/dehydratase family protein [Acidimicrobiia bacterium]